MEKNPANTEKRISMDTNGIDISTDSSDGHRPLANKTSARSSPEIWLYPKALENELKGVDGLSEETVRQTLAVTWEYTRSVIPVYTDWGRYLAFCRVIVPAIVAEFNGALIDIPASDTVLGYDLSALFDIIFAGTPLRDDMAREYRTFLLTTAEKTSNRQGSELFRRYVNALAESPKTWFRIRDTDAILRFSLAAVLTCNGIFDVWFREEQLQILCEIGCTLYDAVAFYKHRAEGETNDTFAYADPSLREEAYQRAREVLWALDVAWAESPAHLLVVNFLRLFGGPIHMMMGRYRFVEDGLTIGKPDTEEVVTQARRHFKLWNRVDSREEGGADDASYREAIRQSQRLLFDGMADLLQIQEPGRERCGRCHYRISYGALRLEQFGGVELCEECRDGWRVHIESLPQRAAAEFPELLGTQLWLDRRGQFPKESLPEHPGNG